MVRKVQEYCNVCDNRQHLLILHQWAHDNLPSIVNVKFYVSTDAAGVLIATACCPIGSSLPRVVSPSSSLLLIPSTQPTSACPVCPTSLLPENLLLTVFLRSYVRYLTGKSDCQTTRSTRRSARDTIQRNRPCHSRTPEIRKGLSSLIGNPQRKGRRKW